MGGRLLAMSRTFKAVDYQTTLDTISQLDLSAIYAARRCTDEPVIRDHKGGAGFPLVLAKGRGGGGRRVVLGVSGVQSEATV